MTTTKQHVTRSIATLRLPKPVPALITAARGVVTAMTNNPSFPSPVPALATVTQAINDLETAEQAAQARTRGAVTTRNEKRAALVALLDALRGYVQSVADAHVENGASIIQSAAIAVKKPAARGPRVFAAKQGTVTGQVHLTAQSAARRASYEWEYSTDGGKTWVTAPVTLQAKTTVSGLAAGTTVQFRYRPVTRTGEGDWSQPTSIIVK